MVLIVVPRFKSKQFGSHRKLQRDWGWSPAYVDAMWRMLQTESPEDFVIATGESNSLEDFVRTAFSEVGVDRRQYVIQDSKLFRPTE
ncbi:MAG: GDP-mannose 4,6-dehydratase, partial [Nitrosospira sp.]